MSYMKRKDLFESLFYNTKPLTTLNNIRSKSIPKITNNKSKSTFNNTFKNTFYSKTKDTNGTKTPNTLKSSYIGIKSDHITNTQKKSINTLVSLVPKKKKSNSQSNTRIATSIPSSSK